MQRPIKPEWLLRQADELAGRTKGAGQPRNADLRRAVSAAYYALFHAVVMDATLTLLAQSGDDDRWRLARHFEHGAVKQVCQWVTNPAQASRGTGKAMSDIASDPAFVDIAPAFLTLLESRHDADYDHLAEFSRPQVLGLVNLARDAIRKLRTAGGSPAHELFVVHLALRTKLH